MGRQVHLVGFVLVTLLVGCGPSPREDASVPSKPQRPATVKWVNAAILGDAPALVQKLTGFGQRGTDVVEELVLAGLTSDDNQGLLRPQLAEAVPSVDNGLWQVSPSCILSVVPFCTMPFDSVRWRSPPPVVSRSSFQMLKR